MAIQSRQFYLRIIHFRSADTRHPAQSGSGSYLFDSVKNILVWTIDYSEFLGCEGPYAGVSVYDIQLEDTVMVLTPREIVSDDDDDNGEGHY